MRTVDFTSKSMRLGEWFLSAISAEYDLVLDIALFCIHQSGKEAALSKFLYKYLLGTRIFLDPSGSPQTHEITSKHSNFELLHTEKSEHIFIFAVNEPEHVYQLYATDFIKLFDQALVEVCPNDGELFDIVPEINFNTGLYINSAFPKEWLPEEYTELPDEDASANELLELVDLIMSTSIIKLYREKYNFTESDFITLYQRLVYLLSLRKHLNGHILTLQVSISEMYSLKQLGYLEAATGALSQDVDAAWSLLTQNLIRSIVCQDPDFGVLSMLYAKTVQT
jgi:hypothetical protein